MHQSIHKSWSSFRITLLLYITVFILPFSFYFVYKSFETMQNDTKMVRLISWTGGAIEHFAIDPSSRNNENMIKNVNTTLQDISHWVMKNDDTELYIGATKLSEDFSAVQSCWNAYIEKLLGQNEDMIKQHSLHCYSLIENLAIISEKMVYLKQRKMINLFYFSLSIAMLLILLTIYMVRIYIHKQMNKHTIHDHESRLFNKKYFMPELKTTCSRSVRHNYPLSILCVSIDNFEKENKTYNNRTKRNTLKVFGILIHSLVRDGDIPCRYDENHFFILLPFTEQENALLLEQRIRQALEKDNWMRTKKIVFKFKTTEFDKKESEEAFITRASDGCGLRG